MADKSNKLKARLPRGLADRGPAAIAATRRMIEAIRTVYERYGFEPVETPEIEYTDALGKFLPDQDRPNEGVFSFKDDDEQWLSLRYDLTAPLARYVAENFDALPKPYRSYRFGWVFRNEKPGPGRFRQFMQFDADTVGSASMAADAEICMMAADTMEALGVPRGSYVVKVNNRKVLDGVLDAIGLGGEENAGKRLTVLRAIDKLDRLGTDGVKLLLGPGRKDDSGDFTKGAGLDDDGVARVLAFVQAKGADANATLGNLGKVVAGSDRGAEGVAELRDIATLTSSSGYADDRILIDPSVVRGLEYYTGPVYEVELTLETKDEKGNPVRFGSIGGGGRYDGLVSRFRGEPVPATGFSIGVSRLQAALTLLDKLDNKPEPGPVVVTVFDRDRIADYQRMVSKLREAGIRAEMYLGSGKFGPQMKYADKRNSSCVVIQGGDEKLKNEVQIKDLILGATLTAIKDRDEYLRHQAEAQFAVPEDKLVDAVRQVLARHGVAWG
jgi:histidyl-tRNA synthetase